MLFKRICYLYPVFFLWYIVQDKENTNWASTEAQLLNKRMSTIKLKIEIKISASKPEVWTCTANKLKISLTYVKVDRKTYTIPLVSKKTVQQHCSSPQTDLDIKVFENGCTLGNPEPRSENTCTSGGILDQNNSPICPAKHSKFFWIQCTCFF